MLLVTVSVVYLLLGLPTSVFDRCLRCTCKQSNAMHCMRRLSFALWPNFKEFPSATAFLS